jgi:putative flavoprotein involved in K+ transport
MRRTDALIIGAGQAGLAMSRCLATRGIDHVVLERGRIAERWRTGSWDSLRLLTPNWLNRLPDDDGDADPHGFMRASGLVERLERYASAAEAPVETQTEVRSVTRLGVDYVVATSRGTLRTRSVVIATGQCQQPLLPPFARLLPRHIHQLTPAQYKRPGQLPDSPVLVVGASASGIQLAEEVHRSGRPVTLSVGEHVRLPRTYRRRDVLWWMDASGVWNQRYDEIDDLARARRLPSPQLVGTPERTTLDLNALSALGVELVGRLAAVRDGCALLSGGLRNLFSLADLKMERLLDTFDDWALTDACAADVAAPERFAPTRAPESSRLQIDLRSGEIRSIVWATGFRPDYSWLDVPVMDQKGFLRHDGGVVVDSPGMYALGLPLLRRRKSSFIDGAEDDAREVIDHLARYLARGDCRGATGR